jgi:hypothetical protein
LAKVPTGSWTVAANRVLEHIAALYEALSWPYSPPRHGQDAPGLATP